MCLLTAIVAHTRLLPSQQLVTAGFVTMIFFGRWQSRKRSRFIPKATRRAVIRRDLKGEAFDPEKHHIDHVWPFSRGGSHTTDNLRVIEKKRNLQKGAKRPRMREMW
jgi:5-methylcytosine-specific restriction endonuclease McrA